MPNPSNPHGFIAEFMFGNGAIPLWYGVLKSAQAVTEGDVLKASAGGLIYRYSTVATDDAKIVGISVETKTAPTTARDSIMFVPALENIVFSGQYGSSGGSVQFTQGIIWTAKNLGPAGTPTGVMRLSSGTSSVACIIGLKRTSAFGTFGEALFVFGVSRISGRGIY